MVLRGGRLGRRKRERPALAGAPHFMLHTDGSCAHYSSRLKPIVNMRPEHRLPPLSLGAGSPHQLSADLHLVDWLEAKSYRYDVITDEDLHREGVELLSPYRVVVSGSHPEYWTRPMIAGLQAYQVRGGRQLRKQRVADHRQRVAPVRLRPPAWPLNPVGAPTFRPPGPVPSDRTRTQVCR